MFHELWIEVNGRYSQSESKNILAIIKGGFLEN